MISLTKHNELKGYKSLEAYPEVAHFVTTRHEGISTGAYSSFNCSPYTNDSCMNVNRNQSWLFQCMNHQIKELFIPEQNHGCAMNHVSVGIKLIMFFYHAKIRHQAAGDYLFCFKAYYKCYIQSKITQIKFLISILI